ncbi:O-antigen ligase family protein [Mesobacillus jeotgali]|uniref:O-antigen ligase family protein n=1 Tax=Mesobacillus jeotgali TaxID=129985 RepID=A0ABY9VHP6_9BACI|nr:O-antigen ligase family protein [Mesobacillus jeotgali]WNF22664.1 O-antigen ligase family protein [Mesobacillus jeotgali]
MYSLSNNYKPTFPMQLVTIAIVSIPIWSLLGIKVFIFHAFAFYFLARTLFLSKGKSELRISWSIIMLFFFIATYGVSLMINSINEPIQRVVGSFYNFSFWLMGFFIILAVYNSNLEVSYFRKLSKSIRNFGLFSGYLGLFLIILWYAIDLKVYYINSLFGQFFLANAPNIIKSSSLINLIRTDYMLGSTFPRLSLFNLYPTALGITTSFILSFTYYYHKTNKRKRLSIKMIFEYVIISIPLVFSLSRTVIITTLICLFFFYFLFSKKNKKFLLKIVLLCMVLLVPVILFSKFENLLNQIIQSREGSSDLRGYVYEKALSYFYQNPIIGTGVKFEEPGIPIPIGSHSTFIGVLMKTGSLGFFTLFAFLSITLFIWYKKIHIFKNENLIIWKVVGFNFISFTLWMVTEDIDAPQIVAFLYFFNISLIYSNISKHTKGELE